MNKILEIPKIKNKNSFKTKILILIFLSVVVGGVMIWQIPDERIKKRDKEIEKIKNRPPKEKYNRDNSCEVYELVATEGGFYPCFHCKNAKTIFLNKGEVWKYGKTCLGQEGRYSQGLPAWDLRYEPLATGTEAECLVLEKQLIYAYPSLPECQKRDFVLMRPPGNKIDN